MAEGDLYPNCDWNLWLRTCEEEVHKPLEGVITGEIPQWLSGALLRNGPGSIKVGSMRFQHVFDSSALIHRFAIRDGTVTYQCRFLQTNTLKKNRAANRIVITGFGTKSVPDPCHSIFERVASIFKQKESCDNDLVSVYPFGDEIYAFAEGPVIHRIDPETLETMESKNMLDYVALVHHTSHPHVMPNGDVYNIGLSVIDRKVRHVVVRFPFVEKGDMFQSAHIAATMEPRWKFRPAYMHTFGITENYFVIVEQPLSLSLARMAKNKLFNEPVSPCLRWNPEQETHIVLLSRETGKEVKRYRTNNVCFLHMINSYEENGKIIVDLCTYKDAKSLDSMYVHNIENMQSNSDFADWVRSRPKRYAASLDAPNLTKIEYHLLANIGCEMPRIHYDLHNGRPYRYFYAMSSDIDIENTGLLIKVDTKTGVTKTWCDTNCYPCEPVFVPSPQAKREDDGVVLSALVWGGARAREVALLVLDARNMQELGRAHFHTPSSIPRTFHGWFLPQTSSYIQT